MYYLIALLLFTFSKSIGQVSPAAEIHCHLMDRSVDSIIVLSPVNNSVFWPAKKTIPVDTNGNIVIPLNTRSLGFISLETGKKVVLLFLHHGDHVWVQIDSAEDSPSHFKGANADGQALLNTGVIPGSVYNILDDFAHDSTATILENHVLNETATKKKLFQQLFDKGKIDAPFLDFARRSLGFLYATVASKTINDRFYRTVYGKNDSIASKRFYNEYAVLWKNQFNLVMRGDTKSLLSPAFINYIESYITEYYTYQHRRSGKELLPMRDEIVAIRKLLKPARVAEFAEAQRMLSYYIQNNFEKDLLTLFHAYQQRYPKSVYTQYLLPFHQQVADFYKAAAKPLTAEQLFVPGYQLMDSLERLYKFFHGKMLYVDMWATWCGPCKDEFKFKDSLYSFLSARQIPILYLSLDNDRSDTQWKNMIRFYDLKGFHARATENIFTQLVNNFKKKEGFSIPRYMLVDPQGRIVEPDALRPSDNVKLYDQIMSHLPHITP